MTKDEIDIFDARIKDKALFQNIAIFLLSASAPLGIEKFIEYRDTSDETSFAILIVCAIAFLTGIICQIIAWTRAQKQESFKKTLFDKDRLLSSTITLVDTSGTESNVGLKTNI